jgi:O-antigen/teichoic acid export membrane protein
VAGGVALTGAVGLTAVAGATVLGDVAVSVAAGTSYLALAPDVWIFAALGASLAVVQVLVYARLAVSDRRLGLAAWAVTPAVCLVVATVAHGSVVEVAATALAGAVVLVVWGLVLERAAFGLGPRNARASEPAPGVPPVPGAPPVPGTRPRS